MSKSLVFLLIVLLSVASAQAALADFLEPLQTHPSLLAAQAELNAAERNLNAAFDPVSVELSGSYLRFDTDDIDADPQTPGDQGLPVNGGAFDVDVSLRPFPFGSIADGVTQQKIALERSRLEYRRTLASLEVQALEAALNVQLAQEGLSLARTGAALSSQALDATEIRFERGAANERELREARSGELAAQTRVTDAAARLELAQTSLESYVGGVAAPQDIALSIPEGTTLGVLSAELGLAGAELAYRSASRGVYPVLSAGYSWNLDENNSLGISIESRTLQPNLSYSFEDPAQSQTGINGSFSLGLSASLSPGLFEQLAAVEEQLSGAKVALAAAQDEAERQLAALESALAEAERALELNSLLLENAQLRLTETQQREELGLSIPLETQEAVLELNEAALDVSQARQDVFAALADSYELYAQPVSTHSKGQP